MTAGSPKVSSESSGAVVIVTEDGSTRRRTRETKTLETPPCAASDDVQKGDEDTDTGYGDGI